jgi:hypothetical protein
MGQHWLRAVQDLKREFESRRESDLLHMLITIDHSICDSRPGERRLSPKAVDQGRQVWPLPPDHYWRLLPGSEDPLPSAAPRINADSATATISLRSVNRTRGIFIGRPR